MFERTLRIGEASYGENHPQVAIYVNNLGDVLRQLGDLAGAKAAFEHALDIFHRSLGAEHPNTKTVQNNLSYLNQQNPGSARS
jgi:hypothetical protein